VRLVGKLLLAAGGDEFGFLHGQGFDQIEIRFA
jgi:hypothetical protein